LERVAERAGVSKGGLLYHFNTKEALVVEMMHSLMDCHETCIRDRVEEGARYAEAVIDACLDDRDKPMNVMPAFIAAIAVDRNAQNLIRQKKRQWRDALLADGLSLSQTMVLSFAMDGLFVTRSLGVADLSPAELEALRGGLGDLLNVRSERALLADWFRQALERIDAEEASPEVALASSGD
jgi:AcrR family transcriptional regulator